MKTSKRLSRMFMILILTAVMLIPLAICQSMRSSSYADSDDFDVSMFGLYTIVYGNGYDSSYFKEGESPDFDLALSWSRFSEGLYSASVTMSFDDLKDMIQSHFYNTDGLEEYLIKYSGEENGKSFKYDKETQEVTLYPMGGGGGADESLVKVQDDVYYGDGELYCSWMKGDTLLRRCVITFRDGAIYSFQPEEKVNQIKVDPMVYDSMLMGLPGDTLTLKASLYQYYQSDMKEEYPDGVSYRWTLDGKVLEENASSIEFTFPEEERDLEIMIEGFLPGSDKSGDPDCTYRIDAASSRCDLSITGTVFGSSKAANFRKLTVGQPYMFCLNGAFFGWNIGNPEGTPFYIYEITGPDKKQIAIAQDAYEGGKKYSTFSDNGAIYGGGMPYRILTFNVPGKYRIDGTIYRFGEIFEYTGTSVSAQVEGTSISKVTPAKKKLTVKWKKQTKGTTSYQIMTALDKKFKKSKKTVNVSGSKATSKVIKGLKSKKTYYVRIRTAVKVNGKTYYSSWSKVKTAKTK